ncbi:MAG: tRNA guanosine(34) transglycosylase Tgt [Dehalococcoidia bacterium]|nr:tRNA guanosine(34) transglycosylase Tgt [Dehalococcoidia bacterium]
MAEKNIFELSANDSNARAGILHTSHGSVPTPVFMPVATQGSVKALDSIDLKNSGAEMILGNAYHLYLRPGPNVIKELGGLHQFMSWSGPILTDSGGFQGFSLEHLRKITEDGITFKSHIDGSIHTFSPENAILHQQDIGADVIMQLDVCMPTGNSEEEILAALNMTTRWAVRCLETFSNSNQLLFGIIQGGVFNKLREKSAEALLPLDFPGYAIGGLSVGESKTELYKTTKFTTQLLPEYKPRYLMGVGSPEDLVEAVASGIDMFDCSLPTRIARNGALFTKTGRANLHSSQFKHLDQPVEVNCNCFTCSTFSAAYLHHLFRAKELSAYRLATIHNVSFILRLMRDIRESIVAGRFDKFRTDFHDHFVPPDPSVRHEQRQKWLRAQEKSRRS